MTPDKPRAGEEPAALHRAGTMVASAIAPVFLLVVGAAFIALNQAPRGGDESQYARATLELFALLESPIDFLRGLITIFPGKPSGLIWLGVAFVPFAGVVGSIDAALQLAILASQVVTVILVFRAVRACGDGPTVPALAAALIVAAAPMYIALGHHYLVEPLQTLSAAWFLYIRVKARAWSRSLLLAQLLAATAFALTTKQTQPLFCIWPGAVVLLVAIRKRDLSTRSEGRWIFASLAIGVPLFAVTTVWYVVNRAYVKHHLIGSAFSDMAKTYWGKAAPYPDSFVYWFRSLLDVLFLGPVAVVWLAVVASGAFVWWRRNKASRYETMLFATVALQVVTVIAAFALSSTRIDRFIVPLLPYAAFLAASALMALNRRIVSAVVVAVFLAQAIAVQAAAFGVSPVGIRGVAPVTRDDAQRRAIAALVERACGGVAAAGRLNVLAVEPSSPPLGGDWLTAEPANYEAARAAFLRGELSTCWFDYPGGDFFGAPADEVWQHLIQRNARFVIVADPKVFPAGPLPYSRLFTGDNLTIFLDRLRSDARFAERIAPPDSPGLLFFERVR